MVNSSNADLTWLSRTNYRGATTSSLAMVATVPGAQLDANGNVSVGGGLPSQVQYSVDGAFLPVPLEPAGLEAWSVRRHGRDCCWAGNDFRLWRESSYEIREYFTNLPNHLNYASPTTEVTSPSKFGKLTSVQTAENGGNRTGQVALRLGF